MGGVPTKHHSKSKVGRRRSQLALKKVHISACPSCKAPTLSHRACPNCGLYVKSNKKPKVKS
ncbi:MAG: 50S ribosomal protein L32 [Minisyncoccia bacterium]